MQEQAAPPRFRGTYPHPLRVDRQYLPYDRFMARAFAKHVDEGDLTQADGVIAGHFPKLVLEIKDPEILALAGPDYANFDNIDCKDIKCTCSDKPRYEQIFSDTTVDHDAIIYNSCKRTIFAAAKRQMKSAPTPALDVAQDFIRFAKLKIRQRIGYELDHFGYSFNQWYNHLTLAKQKRMDAVKEFLYGTDMTQEHYRDVCHSAKYLHYEAICKPEIQPTDGKPRMVCAIPDLIKYVMGPVCWKLEEICQDLFPTYCGGQNLTQMQDKINHYIDDGFCIVAEGDGSAFDNTQDVLLKEVDRFIYNTIADQVHHVPKELFLHIANQYYKIMDVLHVQDGKKQCIMRYAVLGTVFSGDCDTTLMNTLRMGLYNWYTNFKAGLRLGEDFVCFSKGDDFTVMYHIKLGTWSIQDAYRKYWLAKAKPDGPSWDGLDDRCYGLGQILKFIERGGPSIIKFCSLRAWYTDYGSLHIYLTRDPAKFFTLAKYSRKTLHMSSDQRANYLLDQAQALRSSYAGVHYFEKMAQCYEKAAYAVTGPGLKRRPIRVKDRRTTLPLEVPEVYDGFYYEARHGDVKIQGNYWETMQKIERAQETQLTPEQLAMVNSQIDAEFFDRDLNLLVV